MSNQPKHLVRFEVPHRGGDWRGGGGILTFFLLGFFFLRVKQRGRTKTHPRWGGERSRGEYVWGQVTWSGALRRTFSEMQRGEVGGVLGVCQPHLRQGGVDVCPGSPEPLTPEMSVTPPCLVLLPLDSAASVHLWSPPADSVTIPPGGLELYFLRGSGGWAPGAGLSCCCCLLTWPRIS